MPDDGQDPSFADSHAGRFPPESMRVPVGEHAVDDLGEDDLEPLDGGDEEITAEAHDLERHASDDDGPTITSEAPHSEDDEG